MKTAQQWQDELAGDKSGCDSVNGSSAASADAWAKIGRDAMEKAQDAAADGKFGTADEHRKNAELAFGCELKLRQPPNAPGERLPGQPKT